MGSLTLVKLAARLARGVLRHDLGRSIWSSGMTCATPETADGDGEERVVARRVERASLGQSRRKVRGPEPRIDDLRRAPARGVL